MLAIRQEGRPCAQGTRAETRLRGRAGMGSHQRPRGRMAGNRRPHSRSRQAPSLRTPSATDDLAPRGAPSNPQGHEWGHRSDAPTESFMSRCLPRRTGSTMTATQQAQRSTDASHRPRRRAPAALLVAVVSVPSLSDKQSLGFVLEPLEPRHDSCPPSAIVSPEARRQRRLRRTTYSLVSSSARFVSYSSSVTRPSSRNCANFRI